MLTRVYNNVMYMMHHRGMEMADYYIEELSKIDSSSDSELISNDKFHNIGIDFKSMLKSDLKDIEYRLLLSFCLTDDSRKHKQIVFFGNNSRAFIEYMVRVMMANEFPEYECFYVIVTSTKFSDKLKERISVISSKFSVTTFLDKELIKSPFHAYGSKYELMTDKELNTLISELRISTNEMKKISGSKDPIMKYYGWPSKKGVRIIQTPMITGSAVKTNIDYRYIE